MPTSVLWCYPVIAVAYMFLPGRAAGAYSALLLVSTAAVIAGGYGLTAALPFAGSLGTLIALMASMVFTHDRMRRRLADQSITDPLTGAFNRRHLESCLSIAIERRNRTAEPAALVLFDVDHFKAVNDTLGHAAGDDVLKGLVRLVGGRMRTIDVLFRTGGEEFALLLAGARYADALLVAEDLRLLVEDCHLLGAARISISAGVSELQKGQSAYGWIADADQALYRAKRGGRNCVAGRPLANAS